MIKWMWTKITYPANPGLNKASKIWILYQSRGGVYPDKKVLTINTADGKSKCPKLADAMVIETAPELLSILERIVEANGANHLPELKREALKAIARAKRGAK